jgi:thiol-disulfide isomerase/thioredoxin
MNKNLFLSIIGLLLFSTATTAQIRTIELPEYESCNTGSLEISKIEINDSVTVLYCDGFGRPKSWIALTTKSYLKGKSGKIYKFIRSEGFEMDKHIFMPESGNVSFKLYMEALDQTETSFDFMEGEKSDQFQILGIKTYKTKSTSPIHCLLKGEVIDRPQSSRLILIKAGGDLRISAQYITVRNGKFEYELNCQNIEVYELIFQDEVQSGGWRPVTFFAEPDTISLRLYPMDRFNENVIIRISKPQNLSSNKFAEHSAEVIEKGGLNSEWQRYLILKDSIWNSGDIAKEKERLDKEDKKLDKENIRFTNAIKEINKQLELNPNRRVSDSLLVLIEKLQVTGGYYTPEAMELSKQWYNLNEKCEKQNLKYIRENNSLVGYSLLLSTTSLALQEYKNLVPECINLYNSIYAKKYPKHPYTEQMRIKVESFNSIKVGGYYIDFVAPNFTGLPVRLSEQIKGKVALIDLWASWCGPCRKSAKSMIPVYETYKDKGFTIVGVARESEPTAGVNAEKKDKYPWLNLIELKDKGKIWEKYGVGNSGGGRFLVDRNGIILAIDPTADEVKIILDKFLK